ncbi:FAD binding domain-containing protein [Nemania sp. FL0031]|nr:FAD binding domain-containing protein [Nemania sp. FL0031]
MEIRSFSRISLTTFIFILSSATTAGNSLSHQVCRYIPGDAGWPSQSDLVALNTTVGGRLIRTTPLARSCHQTGAFSAYNPAACEDLRTAFQYAAPATICPVAGEIFNPYWQNETCSPFSATETPCELGNRAVFSINATGPADIQAGLEFATRRNIRVVVKNTGIDYLGQSTGQGALAIWTYNLKSTEVIADYKSFYHSGPAIKLGAGVIAGEAYEAAKRSGYRIVAPECGLTGVVGGYVQAGGQSQLVTAYGLAADQVLEWELVTPSGEYLVATPEKNIDLYWALAGGGGGTYGVVLSATFRVYPEGPVAGGEMVVKGKNITSLFEAIEIWFKMAPSFIDGSRNNIQFFVTNDTLTILNFVLPDQNASSIHSLLAPFLPELDRLGLDYNLTATEYPTYLDSYIASYGPVPYGNLCPSFPLIASRLIPRKTVQDPIANQQLIALYRNITNEGTWWIGCSFLNVDDSVRSIRPRHPPNSVHPAWRDAIAYCNPQTHQPYDWTNPAAVSALRKTLVDDIFPKIEAATPGGANLNELDPTYKGDWKAAFFGSNYDRLLRIKHAYDPHRLMYGRFAVGSDEFMIDGSGRLCEV